MAKKVILAIDPQRAAHRTVRTALAPSGHTVIAATSSDEGVAIARRIRPSLLFLSFHLPRGGAINVLHRLQESDSLARVPVVLTAEEEDAIPDDALRAQSVVDRITFPIEPDALLTLTTHLLEKYGEEGVPLIEDAEVIETAEIIDEEEIGLGPEEPLDRKQPTPRERLRRALAAAVASQFERLRQLNSSRHVARWMYDLADRVLEAEFVPSGDERAESSDAALRGDLEAIPLAEIMQLLAMQRQSGGFHMVHRSADITVFFTEGKIDVCQARNLREEFLLGRYLVERGWISREDLDLMLASRKGSKKMLGQQLIRLGYLTEEQLDNALARQSAEMVYEALRWNDGYFFFRAGERPDGSGEISLGLTVESLLMEGFRRVDEWRLVEKKIRNFDEVYERDEGRISSLSGEKLTPEEKKILGLVDGSLTVRELVRRSHQSSFDASKVLYRLLSMRLIRSVKG